VKYLIYIVTIDHSQSVNKNSDYSKYCLNTWKYWCNKHNIDLYTITEHDERFKYAVWNKELIYKIGEGYDKIGIVDSDTMVRWDAPNIFEQIGEEVAGVVDTADLRWITNSINNYGDAFFKNEAKLNIDEYFNAGVLFFDKKYLNVFKQVLDFYLDNKIELDNWNKGGGKEQTILNYFLVKNKVNKKELLPEWNLVAIHKKDMFKHNWQLNKDMTPFFIKYAYVWHFTGFDPSNRENLMKQTWDLIKHNYE